MNLIQIKNTQARVTAQEILDDILDIYSEKYEEYNMEETEDMLNDITSRIEKHYLFKSEYVSSRKN